MRMVNIIVVVDCYRLHKEKYTYTSLFIIKEVGLIIKGVGLIIKGVGLITKEVGLIIKEVGLIIKGVWI